MGMTEEVSVTIVWQREITSSMSMSESYYEIILIIKYDGGLFDARMFGKFSNTLVYYLRVIPQFIHGQHLVVLHDSITLLPMQIPRVFLSCPIVLWVGP